jgi:hypothetical protein
MHWILAAVAERWPALKRFLLPMALLVAGALAMMFLYDEFIIPGKDATIQALQTRSQNSIGLSPIYAVGIWEGPTNRLYLTNQYTSYFYPASSNCAVTAVSSLPSITQAAAELAVFNTSSNTIVLYLTDTSARPIGFATTNALAIPGGKLGFFSIRCYGQSIKLYENLPQQ